MELDDLLKLEKASRIVCIKYENVSRNYDGTIIEDNNYEKFKKYNDFHNKIINDIEQVINGEIKKNNV